MRTAKLASCAKLLLALAFTIIPMTCFATPAVLSASALMTNPNIAYILLLFGIYGLFFEFYHPGLILPGVLGGIALLLGVYSFYFLHINYVGFALLLLGIIFMMIEVFISSLGILAVAGVIAFITGSILLLDIISPGYHISWSLITMMTVFTVGFFLLIITLSIRAQQRKINSGREGMIGATGSALEYLHGHWLVSIDDEIWEANSPTELKPGQKIRVLKITGLILTVEPLRTKKQREAVKTL